MRDLLNSELAIVSGGEGFNYWRAGFDITGGGLIGTVIGDLEDIHFKT